jgi:hypothetical protein
VDELEKKIAQLEAEHPDVLKGVVRKPLKVIWQRRWAFYTEECDHNDVMNDDCRHPPNWHCMPIRIRAGDQGGMIFEIIRRRPDGWPGEDWSPMNPTEITRVRNELLSDRVAQLIGKPEVEDA